MARADRFFRFLRRRQQERRTTVSITLSLFILLVSFAVIGRLIQLDIVVTSMCDPEVFRGKSPSSISVSLVEWIIIIALLAASLQLINAIAGAVQDSIRWLPVALGGVNLLLAAGLLLFWGQLWAFWHPDEAAGRFISQTVWNLPIPKPRMFTLERGERIRRVYGENDPNWTVAAAWNNGKPVYVHKATGVTNTYERVSACFPPEIYRANVRMMVAVGVLDQDAYKPDMTDEIFDWILRDPKGAIILAPHFRTDPIGRELKRQQSELTPALDWDALAEIFTREQDMQESKKPLSFDEFQETYMCIKEKQRQGKYPSCL